MVWSGWGRPRGSGRYGGAWGRGGGPWGGYGGGGWGGGYGRGPRYGGGGGGGCLRDLFLVETGCCLAEALGCGPQMLLVAPAALTTRASGEGTWALRLVRAYRREISPRRARPCCRMTPSCSAYAEEALLTHGTRRGLALTARRLLRCRPGGGRGYDPVPPVR